MLQLLKSKCCNQPLNTSFGEEGTNCYVCSSCKKPSDPVVQELHFACLCAGPRGRNSGLCDKCLKQKDPIDNRPKIEGKEEKNHGKNCVCENCKAFYSSPKVSERWEEKLEKIIGRGLDYQDVEVLIRDIMDQILAEERARIVEILNKCKWDESGKGDFIVSLSDVIALINKER